MQADLQTQAPPIGRTTVEPAHLDAWLDTLRALPKGRQVRLLQLHYSQVPAAQEFAEGRFQRADSAAGDRVALCLAQLVIGAMLQPYEFGPWLLDRMQHGDLKPAVRHAFEALHVRHPGPVKPWG